MKEFERKASGVTWHIPSKFTKEMSALSEVVSTKWDVCCNYLPPIIV